eukprot:3585807-Amphidinium_carterae.1
MHGYPNHISYVRRVLSAIDTPNALVDATLELLYSRHLTALFVTSAHRTEHTSRKCVPRYQVGKTDRSGRTLQNCHKLDVAPPLCSASAARLSAEPSPLHPLG